MRVLSHGVPFNNSYTAIERYGGPHEIRSLGAHEPDSYVFDYHYDPVSESFSDVIDRIGKEWMPDLFLCWYPANIPPPPAIEDAPIPTAALVSDWNLFYPVLAANLARFDHVLCDKGGVEVLRSDLVEPRYLMPLQAQNSAVHRPHDIEKDIDIVYVGSLISAMRPERSCYLERLAALSGDCRIFIGTGYEGEDYARLLSRARIVFNHSVRSELNLRVFETMACGSVAFLEEGNAEVRDWFEDGADIVLYNEDNFEERLRTYLAEPERAEAVAARGLERAAGFAGENRFDMLIDGLAAQPSGQRRFRDLPLKEREFHTLLMYGNQWLLPYRNLEAVLVKQFASQYPDDPRASTAIGRYFANAYVEVDDIRKLQAPCASALAEAHRLCPASAPFALNAAWGCRWAGETREEEKCLRMALEADSMEGAELILGDYADPFWIRWQGLLARGRASGGLLHAEVHRRLAYTAAGRGESNVAESHILEAQRLDPDNPVAAPLLADIQWRTGRQAEALETLTAALPGLPFDLESRARLRTMLVELGRTEEADRLERQTAAIARALDEPKESRPCAS